MFNFNANRTENLKHSLIEPAAETTVFEYSKPKRVRSNGVSIRTRISATEVLNQLKRITAEKFDDAMKNPKFKYYGMITGTKFRICSKSYDPMSNGPWIIGEVSSKMKDTIMINVEAGNDEQVELVTKLLYPFFIFFGLTLTGIGVAMTENRLVYVIAGIGLIASSYLFVKLIKMMMNSMQNDELKKLKGIIS